MICSNFEDASAVVLGLEVEGRLGGRLGLGREVQPKNPARHTEAMAIQELRAVRFSQNFIMSRLGLCQFREDLDNRSFYASQSLNAESPTQPQRGERPIWTALVVVDLPKQWDFLFHQRLQIN